MKLAWHMSSDRTDGMNGKRPVLHQFRSGITAQVGAELPLPQGALLKAWKASMLSGQLRHCQNWLQACQTFNAI